MRRVEINPTKDIEIPSSDRAKKEFEKKHTIKYVTPLALNVRDKEQAGVTITIASLTFLCIDGKDNFLTISRNYIVENDDEREALSFLDLNMNNMGINVKICAKQIINKCPCYVSQFDFSLDRLSENFMWLTCLDSQEGQSQQFKVGIDSFFAMTYIEDMVFKCEVGNDMFFNLATIIGTKEEYKTTFSIVDSIETIGAITNGLRRPVERLKAIAELLKDEATEKLAVVALTDSRDSDSISHKFSIMFPFETENKYKKSKFKGMIIEKMEKEFYGKDDQYSSTIAIDGIEVLDETYYAVRAKNSKGDTKIFLFSNEIQEKLNKKIEEF